MYPPGLTYVHTTSSICLCNATMPSVFFLSRLYLISGFLPIIPIPEQGTSASNISALLIFFSLLTVASIVSTTMLSSPRRSIFSLICPVFLSEISRAITCPVPSSCNAAKILFPPGAAHTSMTLSPCSGATITPSNILLMS